MGLKIRGLSAGYGGQVHIEIGSLAMGEPGTLVLLGRSGSGKSTLLRVIAGLLSPYDGEVWLDGTNIWALTIPDRRRWFQQVGMVFQEGALFDSMTVEENLRFPLECGRAPRAERSDRVLNMLKGVGLDESALPKYPAELSGGMRRRVGLARALISQPRALLVDEPTMGLDPITSRLIVSLISGFRDRLDYLVLATHQMELIDQIGDRIVLIERGKMVIETSREQFMKLWRGESEPETNGEAALVQFVEGRATGPLEVVA
jgi:phospholipid/cholesterol/gamma-HCH transport system ATP-binding protein